MQETLDAGTRRTVGPTAAWPGGAPSLIAWNADTPGIGDGLVSGSGKRK